MKNKMSNWIMGIGCGEHRYKIDNVIFTVSSRFEQPKSENSIKRRLEQTIISNFAPLTNKDIENKMIDEYVCSGCIASADAEKEENSAVEKEN